MGGIFGFSLLNFKKGFAKIYMISAFIGFLFVIGYKIFFIDVFNQNYVKNFLEIGLKPTSTLVSEFFEAITTCFNPVSYTHLDVYKRQVFILFLILFSMKI